MRITAQKFGEAVDAYACEQTVTSVESLLRPSGIKVFSNETVLWEWYQQLAPEQRKMVIAFAEALVASACFNLCAMLDGIGGVEPFNRGTFELYYVEQDARYHVNAQGQEMLHTALSAANVARRQRAGGA